jgi:hypothetical protein
VRARARDPLVARIGAQRSEQRIGVELLEADEAAAANAPLECGERALAIVEQREAEHLRPARLAQHESGSRREQRQRALDQRTSARLRAGANECRAGVQRDRGAWPLERRRRLGEKLGRDPL